MPTIKPFDRQGYYTVFDNFAIDNIMPAISGNAWKVFSFVLRKTRGYHKESDMIALIQIRQGTGIKNNTTVVKATTELEGLGVIVVHRPDDQKTPNTYSINREFEAEIDDSGQLVQKIDMVKKCTSACLKNGHTKHKDKHKDTTTTHAQNSYGQVIEPGGVSRQLLKQEWETLINKPENSDIPITPDELRQMGHDVPQTEQRSDLGQISDLYLSNIGGISPIIGDAMKAYMDDILTTINRQPFHTGESVLSWFQYAINEAVDNDKRNWGYVKAILEGVIKSGSLKAHKASRPVPATNGKVKAMPELTPAQEEAAEVMRVGLGGVKTPQREAEVRAAIIALFSDGSLKSAEGMRRYLSQYRNSWMGKDSPHPASPRRILDTWGAVMAEGAAQNGGGDDPTAIKLTDEEKEAVRAMDEKYG